MLRVLPVYDNEISAVIPTIETGADVENTTFVIIMHVCSINKIYRFLYRDPGRFSRPTSSGTVSVQNYNLERDPLEIQYPKSENSRLGLIESIHEI